MHPHGANRRLSLQAQRPFALRAKRHRPLQSEWVALGPRRRAQLTSLMAFLRVYLKSIIPIGFGTHGGMCIVR